MRHLYLAGLVLALFSCRSQKCTVTNEADSVAVDAVRVESFRASQKSDSSACEAYVTFLPEGGEINIGPSGSVNLKGVAKARVSGRATSTSVSVASASADSISVAGIRVSETKSGPAKADRVTFRSEGIWLAALAVIVILIILFLRLWHRLNR